MSLITDKKITAMDSTDLKLLASLLDGKITKWYFIENYSGDLSDGVKHCGELLTKALASKNTNLVEFGLSLGSYFGYLKEDSVDLLNRLLLEDWHHSHEDIVSLLQDMKSPKSVEPLYETALKQFNYLNYDDSFGLARKCTWALSVINTNESIAKLKLLSQAENPSIRQYANKRLNEKS